MAAQQDAAVIWPLDQVKEYSNDWLTRISQIESDGVLDRPALKAMIIEIGLSPYFRSALSHGYQGRLNSEEVPKLFRQLWALFKNNQEDLVDSQWKELKIVLLGPSAMPKQNIEPSGPPTSQSDSSTIPPGEIQKPHVLSKTVLATKDAQEVTKKTGGEDVMHVDPPAHSKASRTEENPDPESEKQIEKGKQKATGEKFHGALKKSETHSFKVSVVIPPGRSDTRKPNPGPASKSAECGDAKWTKSSTIGDTKGKANEKTQED
ncbi:hypothetical protein CPB83DRAFT_886103, partial [Crepidotus variabilis]